MNPALERYIAELQDWGSRMNLVGSTDRADLLVHVEDARPAAEALPRNARVVDLGSGAGLPGIPLAIERPDLALTLVEVRERRVHFLRHVVRVLSLEIEVRRADFRDPPEQPFDFALARAVSPVDEMLPLALPWVETGGEVWIWSRIPAGETRVAGATSLPLGSEGRGAILRIPAAAVSRGTLPDD